MGNDLRYALRTLRSSPGFAIVAILSLALGIGANTAIFSLIDAVMLKTLPVSRPEELLQVTANESGSFTNPLWEQVRDRQDVLSGVFASSPARFNLARGGEARYAPGTWVSGDFFDTLGVRAVLGRTLNPADDRRGCAAAAVLSFDFWQNEYGGSSGVLGQSISLDGHPFQILGVTQTGFSGIDVGRAAEVFVPICAEPMVTATSQLDNRRNWWLRVVGRPKPGLSAQQVTARLKTLAPEMLAATLPLNTVPEDQRSYLGSSFGTQPAANGLSVLRARYSNSLLMLMALVGVVLAISCANVANLLVARATVRQKEIAIRLAIGAGRARLIRQLLTESLLLALAGAALGILFAQWGSQLLAGLLSSSSDRVFLDLAVNGRVLAFTAVVAIATGVLFGLVPAWRATRIQPHAAMQAGSRAVAEGHSRFNPGKLLVMAQVALSLVLLVGAGLFMSTFRNLATLDAGFERDHVLLVNVDLRNPKFPPERRAAIYEEMLTALRGIPGVRSAAASTLTPVSGLLSLDFLYVDGKAAKSRNDSYVFINRVSPGFFETLATPLLAGRDFEKRDGQGAPPVAIVNETMARMYFGNENPIGRRYRTESGGAVLTEIVGVVKDAKYATLREDLRPIVYLPLSQWDKPGPLRSFEVRSTGSAASLIPGVKDALDRVNRDVTIEFRTLAVQLAESIGRERLLATLSGFFGALALLLSTIGLYGVMSYNVARRRNEIAIRMALGAERAHVMRMVLGEIGLIVAAGLGAGLAATLASTRLVTSFLFGLKPTDPATLLLAASLLAAVALCAGYLPARRASRVDPREVWRNL